MIEQQQDQEVAALGLDPDELRLHGAFLQIDASDRARLGAMAGALRDCHAEAVERLYAHLDGFAPLAAMFGDGASRQRLEQRQRAYFQRLWEGPYDLDYLADRLHIGRAHQRVGLGLKWYLGAYRLYLDHMLQTLLGDDPRVATCRSLLKAAFFDMALTADTYGAAEREALAASEARYARALRGANDGIWEWDPDRDRLDASPRWLALLGLTPEAFGGRGADWFGQVHPDDLPGLEEAIAAHLDGLTGQLHHEFRLRRPNGCYRWVLARAIADRGADGRRLAGSLTDISPRKEIEQQLRHAARHDPLTGLANRTRLDELLARVAARRPGDGPCAALLFVDLDRFKLINDSLGHAVGDQVLVEVSARLRRCLRPGDHLCRFGGDEFVVLLDGLPEPDAAERVAERMLASLREPLALPGQPPLTVSASIGLAPLDGTPSQALQAADLALYRAKAGGRARLARYSRELSSQARHQLALESALAQALDADGFELHYQPIHRLHDEGSTPVGVEALLRWRHQGRLVAPGEFIGALEETGLIVPVGEWVLRESCRQTQAWRQAGHRLHCSVNLSSRQVAQGDFAARLTRILADTGLPPAALVLEITERLLMHDDPATLATLREVARLGVRLALDDFGTGYCSLAYLTRFPLHILKVDRSFIGGAPDNPELATIARAIIGLGRSLGLEVVAEGVERPAHLALLRAEGCPLAQGFGLGRPLPADQLAALLAGVPTYAAALRSTTAAVQPKNQ